MRTLRRVNRLREERPGSPEHRRLEAEMEERFGVSRRLAVYGTLRPGESNFHVVSGLRGQWLDGVVRGEWRPDGWDEPQGYPAFRWDPEGNAVEIGLLVSPDLPAHWNRLDAFEGPGYLRILIPVAVPAESAGAGTELPGITVANLYEDR